jgi:hypothetical protein
MGFNFSELQTRRNPKESRRAAPGENLLRCEKNPITSRKPRENMVDFSSQPW